jgi:hypothetical protein
MNTFEDSATRNLPAVTERPRAEHSAARWQITLTFVAAAAIVAIFLWGLNNQRIETGGQETAATQPAPAAPQSTGQQAAQPSTTENSQQQQPKAGTANPSSTTGSGSSEASPPPQQKQNNTQ